MSAPWFKFFAADWLLSPSVRLMTAEQRGIYVQLLAEQWYSGNGLPADDRSLTRLAGCTIDEWARSKDSVLAHFHADDMGRLRNEKLHKLQVEAITLGQERSAAGRRGNRKRWGNRNCDRSAITKPSQRDRDSDSDSDSDSDKKSVGARAFVRPTLEQVTTYCRERDNHLDPQAWLDHYESNGWRVGRTPMKDWRAAIRTWEKNGIGATDQGSRQPTDHFMVGTQPSNKCPLSRCDGSGCWFDSETRKRVTCECSGSPDRRP